MYALDDALIMHSDPPSPPPAQHLFPPPPKKAPNRTRSSSRMNESNMSFVHGITRLEKYESRKRPSKKLKSANFLCCMIYASMLCKHMYKLESQKWDVIFLEMESSGPFGSVCVRIPSGRSIGIWIPTLPTPIPLPKNRVFLTSSEFVPDELARPYYPNNSFLSFPFSSVPFPFLSKIRLPAGYGWIFRERRAEGAQWPGNKLAWKERVWYLKEKVW